MSYSRICMAVAILLAGPGTAPAHAQASGMMGRGMMGSHGNAMPGRPGGAPGALPADVQGTGSARLFAQACSRCHALPDPQAHMAEDWPAVVSRMEGYMRQAGRSPLSAGEVERIDDFLEQHAVRDR